MRLARAADGESFGLLTSNPRVDSQVQLDVKLIEADQIAAPGLELDRGRYVDGILFDVHGNALSYDILREHPGDNAFSLANNYYSVGAASVIHYFRCDRPGQIRGIPDITPALPLFAQLRRFTLAVLAAAETAGSSKKSRNNFCDSTFIDTPHRHRRHRNRGRPR